MANMIASSALDSLAPFPQRSVKKTSRNWSTICMSKFTKVDKLDISADVRKIHSLLQFC